MEFYFPGHKSGVTTQVRENFLPNMLGVHCDAHWITHLDLMV
jgi:hypothetical protein